MASMLLFCLGVSTVTSPGSKKEITPSQPLSGESEKSPAAIGGKLKDVILVNQLFQGKDTEISHWTLLLQLSGWVAEGSLTGRKMFLSAKAQRVSPSRLLATLQTQTWLCVVLMNEWNLVVHYYETILNVMSAWIYRHEIAASSSGNGFSMLYLMHYAAAECRLLFRLLFNDLVLHWARSALDGNTLWAFSSVRCLETWKYS